MLFVLGGPGAGKGTQCARLVADYGFVHLSAGDLLRAERDSGSPDGAMITQFINEGKIVPVEVTVNLIKKAMVTSGGSKFLVDGFPRNQSNLEGWFATMGDAVRACARGAVRVACCWRGNGGGLAGRARVRARERTRSVRSRTRARRRACARGRAHRCACGLVSPLIGATNHA